MKLNYCSKALQRTIKLLDRLDAYWSHLGVLGDLHLRGKAANPDSDGEGEDRKEGDDNDENGVVGASGGLLRVLGRGVLGSLNGFPLGSLIICPQLVGSFF